MASSAGGGPPSSVLSLSYDDQEVKKWLEEENWKRHEQDGMHAYERRGGKIAVKAYIAAPKV